MTSSWFDVRAALPGLRGRTVHVVGASREAEIRAALVAAGFDIGVVEGATVHDLASLFRQAARALNLPAHFGHNWDALNDALGDVAEGDRRVAVLWKDADRSLAADPQAVLDAVIAFDASTAEGGTGGQGQLELFLFL
jgi:RNAse (barnase) inhibitor barstar